MATLPSSHPQETSRVHLLRRAPIEGRAEVRRRPLSAGQIALVGLAVVLVLLWAAPRIYQPHFIEVDALDSKRITYCKRQWFGRTLRFQLEARFDRELKTWVWMHKDAYDQWTPFFREQDDGPDRS